MLAVKGQAIPMGRRDEPERRAAPVLKLASIDAFRAAPPEPETRDRTKAVAPLRNERRRFTFRLDPVDHARMMGAAAGQGISANALLTRALRDLLEPET